MLSLARNLLRFCAELGNKSEKLQIHRRNSTVLHVHSTEIRNRSEKLTDTEEKLLLHLGRGEQSGNLTSSHQCARFSYSSRIAAGVVVQKPHVIFPHRFAFPSLRLAVHLQPGGWITLISIDPFPTRHVAASSQYSSHQGALAEQSACHTLTKNQKRRLGAFCQCALMWTVNSEFVIRCLDLKHT